MRKKEQKYQNNYLACSVFKVMGVQSDLLFPVQQQRELEELLKESGNHSVTYYELPSIFGHDTFLLDVNAVAAAIKVSNYDTIRPCSI